MRDVAQLESFPVETSGLDEVANYTIEADAAMFHVLMAGLYSDKPRAIVRELATNARDAHADAGILDRPWKLTLPTRWDDTFSVRDYGVSLTHEQVMGLYTTVGKSTKKNSNVSVGKFGLGSKVPFAYTDSFTVTAILAGEKRIYNALMDQGKPKLALLVREPTDEEQGLEVSFPVQQKDVDAFYAAAIRVLAGFDVIPENNRSITKPAYNVLFEGADWKVIESNYMMGLDGFMVKQGCVLYPIDANALRNVRPCESLRILSDCAIILDMPIGSVEITPSRESLSYDPTTSKNLLDKFDSILGEITETLTKSVTEAPTRWAAVKARQVIITKLLGNHLRGHIQSSLKWRGKGVNESITLDYKKIDILRRHGVNLNSVRHYPSRATKYGDRGGPFIAHSISIGTNLPAFVYYGEETPKHLRYRLQAVLAQHNQIFMLPQFSPGGKAELYLRAAMGRPTEPLTFIDLDTIKFNKPEPSARFLADVNKLDEHRRSFDATFENRGQPVYYVKTWKGQIKRDDNVEPSNDAVISLWESLKENVLCNDAVMVAIPASRKDILKAIPEDWIDFWAFATDAVKTHFDADAANKSALFHKVRNHGCNAAWLNFLSSFKPEVVSKVVNPGSSFLAAYYGSEDFRTCQKRSTFQIDLQNYMSLVLSRDEIEAISGNDKTDYALSIEKFMTRVGKDYPLIVELKNYHHTSKCWEHIIDYVNMLDSRKQP